MTLVKYKWSWVQYILLNCTPLYWSPCTVSTSVLNLTTALKFFWVGADFATSLELHSTRQKENKIRSKIKLTLREGELFIIRVAVWYWYEQLKWITYPYKYTHQGGKETKIMLTKLDERIAGWLNIFQFPVVSERYLKRQVLQTCSQKNTFMLKQTRYKNDKRMWYAVYMIICWTPFNLNFPVELLVCIR